jgi:hypothetical protein
VSTDAFPDLNTNKLLQTEHSIHWGTGIVLWRPTWCDEMNLLSDYVSGYSSTSHEPVLPCANTEAATVVVVLGMHRSGTSLCMNLLQALGVQLDDDLVPGDTNNESGYFESRGLVDLNERILRVLGANWQTLFSLMVADGWTENPALLPEKEALRDLIHRKACSRCGPWGFKDPRVTVLLPLYNQVFMECGLEPSYVLCLRDPRAVAQSLRKRNGFPTLLSELLWLDYAMPAIHLAGKRLRQIIFYERWFEDPVGQADSLARAVGMEAPEKGLDTIVRSVVAPRLNHAEVLASEFELACCRLVYRHLLAGNVANAERLFGETWQAMRLLLGASSAGQNPPEGGQILGAPDKRKIPVMGGAERIMSQVFWRLAENDFEETASVRGFTDNTASRRIVRLPIPAGLGPKVQLRLDPADRPGISQFFGIKLLNASEAIQWEWDGLPHSLASMIRRDVVVLERIDESGVFLYLPTSDPSILLPVGAVLEKLSETGGLLELDFAWCGTIYSP